MNRSTERGGLRERRCRRAGAVLLSGCVLTLAFGCGRAADEEIASDEEPTITADTAKVARKDLEDLLTVRGSVRALPNQDVKISALVPGRVVAMKAAEGDAIAAGQVVAEIDPQPLHDQRQQQAAALDQAKAALENARLNLARTEKLFERGIAAGKEVEDARAQQAEASAAVEQATAALNAADRQLDRTKVISPIAGRVVRRLISVGEQVDGTAAQPLLEVANLDQVELAAGVPARQVSRVRVGQRVTVLTDAYPDRSFAGEVVAMAPSVDPETNTALGRIAVRNADRLLKVGMYAQARIVVGERRQALIVPASALARGDTGTAVYVVADGIAQRTPVVVGLETADGVEIVSGVTEGQVVLTSSVHGLGERARLAPAS